MRVRHARFGELERAMHAQFRQDAARLKAHEEKIAKSRRALINSAVTAAEWAEDLDASRFRDHYFSWCDRNRTRINIELAGFLAQLEELQQAQKVSFAKLRAIQEVRRQS